MRFGVSSKGVTKVQERCGMLAQEGETTHLDMDDLNVVNVTVNICFRGRRVAIPTGLAEATLAGCVRCVSVHALWNRC